MSAAASLAEIGQVPFRIVIADAGEGGSPTVLTRYTPGKGWKDRP